MKNLIQIFSKQHLFANFAYLGVLIGGFFFWYLTPKDEMPDFTLDRVTISTFYPGASAGEVEYFVTNPLEQVLKSIDRIDNIQSKSIQGNSTIIIELEKNSGKDSNLLTEIRDVVYSVDLPNEIEELPKIIQFKTSKKAIIDIGLFLEGKKTLSVEERKRLQELSFHLENRLLSLDPINNINRSGYLKNEIQIQLFPEKLKSFQIPIQTISNSIIQANIRQPSGTLENSTKDRVTVNGELRSKNELESIIIQGGFEGHFVRLSQLGIIKDQFEKTNQYLKVNGHEAIILEVVKKSSIGILDAVDLVKKEVKIFEKENYPSTNLKIAILDDESRDVRNRISLITSNGLIGFILIVSILFIFLNFKTGFWVAMGIPFSFSVTLILGNLFGFTINNMTLAAVIIVMGMIVDDAIVVSENILRLRNEGKDFLESSVIGTVSVLLPVTASIITTCIAFLPLLAFEGRLSLFSDSIPPIVIMMLTASFIESIFLLPAHLNYDFPRWTKVFFSFGLLNYFEKYFQNMKKSRFLKKDWFLNIESYYSKKLQFLLIYRIPILIFFILIVIISSFIFSQKMKFTLFPNEETDEVTVFAEAPPNFNKYQTAILSKQIENVFVPYLQKDLIGFRTEIGQARYHSSSLENVLMIKIELVNVQNRKTSLKNLFNKWEKELKIIKGFKQIRLSKKRFGATSGSAIEVIVEENNNEKRKQIAELLALELKKLPGIQSSEVNEPFRNIEYTISPKRDFMKRLGIKTLNLSTTIRTILEGRILYKLLDDNGEETNVRISIDENSKKNIYQVLNVPIENDFGYLVPLKDLIEINKTDSPMEIQRLNGKRILIVYADLKTDSLYTPLEIASHLEEQIFPKLKNLSSTTSFSFDGEIKNSRESTGFFVFGVLVVLLFIYMILALQFNSLLQPIVIMTCILPAFAFIVIVFWLHGKTTYGFFSVIGAMGLAGVVVNNAIILIEKLKNNIDPKQYLNFNSIIKDISDLSATRLKAVFLTTTTTIVGLIPTAYGFAGYDAMLAEMMFALAWGLIFGSVVTLILIPSIFTIIQEYKYKVMMLKDKKFH